MKKLNNITGIILFIILFCSCTPSGKLNGIKYADVLTKKQINVTTSPKGLKDVIVTYNGSGTLPVTAGPYIPMTISLIDWAEVDRQNRRDSIIGLSLIIGIPVLLFAIGWIFGRKYEEITLPDEYLNEQL